MKYNYHYFISYDYIKNNEWGKGNAEIPLKTKLSKISQFATIERSLIMNNSSDNVVINGFELLRRSRA